LFRIEIVTAFIFGKIAKLSEIVKFFPIIGVGRNNRQSALSIHSRRNGSAEKIRLTNAA
jgi:hypothetical protein